MMATTLENNNRALNARLNSATAMMTASDHLKLEFKKIEHEAKMLDYAEMKEQAQVVQEQGIAKKITLECQLLEIEVKDADWNYNQKVKGDEE